MAWKLYKPGQGYWTRMLSAIGGGVLVVAGVAWLMEKLSVLQAPYMIYVKAGLSLLIIGVFGMLLYRWLGIKPRSCDFLIATEGEMKKVNWPVRKEIVGSTIVVIGCVALLASLLFLSDFLFAWFFQEIGILNV